MRAVSPIRLVLDTDHVGELQLGTSQAARELRDRLSAADDTVATTIITVEEQMRGWLAVVHGQRDPRRQISSYLRLQKLFGFFAAWRVLPWDAPAVAVFERLQRTRTRIGTMDLKIASIALASDAMLLSRNLRDFEKVPELRVEDWLS